MQIAFAGLYEWSSVPVYFTSLHGEQIDRVENIPLSTKVSEGLVYIVLPYLVSLDQENGTTTIQQKTGCFLYIQIFSRKSLA